MWDIKFTKSTRSKPGWWLYYLNHVGYKVKEGEETKLQRKQYYLNHVGYKVDFLYFLLFPAMQYYLNHVGYKVVEGMLFDVVVLSII